MAELTTCPRCGTIVAIIFPMHHCVRRRSPVNEKKTAKKKAKKASKKKSAKRTAVPKPGKIRKIAQLLKHVDELNELLEDFGLTEGLMCAMDMCDGVAEIKARLSELLGSDWEKKALA